MTFPLAIDISLYQQGITPQQAKDAGVEAVIVGCQNQDVAHAQIVQFQKFGIPVIATYGFLWDVNSPYNPSPEARVGRAIHEALEHGIGYVALDVEDGDSVPDGIVDRILSIEGCRNLVRAAGLQSIIYTYQYFWEDKMQNNASFSSLPLWYASYGVNDTHKAPVEKVDFGGWTSVAIHQFTSNWPVGNFNVDCNYVIDPRFLQGGDEPMTPTEKEEFEQLKKDRDRLLIAQDQTGKAVFGFKEDGESSFQDTDGRYVGGQPGTREAYPEHNLYNLPAGAPHTHSISESTDV